VAVAVIKSSIVNAICAYDVCVIATVRLYDTDIGVACIFSGVHFFPQKVDNLKAETGKVTTPILQPEQIS